MHRIRTLLVLSLACFTTSMQAQAPAPKSNPALKKLHAAVGHWKYEGEAKAGPGCLGGKFTGEMTCRMILGGAFLQCQFTEKTPAGEWLTLHIEGYDPVKKKFRHDSYADDGSRNSGELTIAGKTWTYVVKALKWVSEEGQYQYKGTFVFAPDLASGTFTDELSSDGKTWTTCEQSKYVKVKPAAQR